MANRQSRSRLRQNFRRARRPPKSFSWPIGQVRWAGRPLRKSETPYSSVFARWSVAATFNIIGFGSTVHALFPQSRLYDDASLRDASAHVATLEADLGGTEILPALHMALEQPRAASLARQIVVLTDGEVSNTDAVLALAAQHAASARIFTFGIGAGASHHLVKGLARTGGGAAEFIYPR